MHTQLLQETTNDVDDDDEELPKPKDGKKVSVHALSSPALHPWMSILYYVFLAG